MIVIAMSTQSWINIEKLNSEGLGMVEVNVVLDFWCSKDAVRIYLAHTLHTYTSRNRPQVLRIWMISWWKNDPGHITYSASSETPNLFN